MIGFLLYLQALAAQKFREQKEEERRRRIEELRQRDHDRRHQVEERKRQIWEAERDRREAILRKNQVTKIIAKNVSSKWMLSVPLEHRLNVCGIGES